MNSPQSVTRVIHILEALCSSPEPLSLADLSRMLDTPKSSLAALLRGLSEAHFVAVSDGAYRLGSGAFGLGSALLEARRRVQSSDLIREGMRRLAHTSGETVLFAVLDHGGTTMTYIDLVESQNAVRFAVSPGDRRPLYCTAGGRILLSTWPEPDLRRYLKQLKPQSLTTSTETNKTKLRQLIEAAREAGIAQTDSQTSEGGAGTAAAIRGASGQVVGSLIVAAPSTRFRDRAPALCRMVLEEASRTSRSLGYRP